MSEPVIRDLNQELRFPLWLLRTEEFAALRRASPLAVRVLLCIWAHGHGYRTICYPGEKRIAGLCKTSVSSVSALIRLLEQAGWLDVRRQRERGEGNVYRLQVPVTLRATADRIQAWLEGPVSGTEPAPVVEGVVMAGDLWGQAGKGRRRQRFARISLAEVNSDTWDLLWRTDSVAGHLWLMLQAYSASKEQLSLARLGRELKVRPSAVSSALARLRRESLLVASEQKPRGSVHTVAAPVPAAQPVPPGAVVRPGRGKMRASLPRAADGRWVHRESSRPRRVRAVRAAQAAPQPGKRAPGREPKRGPREPEPSSLPPRWCGAHGRLAAFCTVDLRYGGLLDCGCSWLPGVHDVAPDPRRPADYQRL